MRSSRLCGGARSPLRIGLPWSSAASTRGRLSAGFAAPRDSPVRFPAAWQEESSPQHGEGSGTSSNSLFLVSESGFESSVSLSLVCSPLLGMAAFAKRLGKTAQSSARDGVFRESGAARARPDGAFRFHRRVRRRNPVCGGAPFSHHFL